YIDYTGFYSLWRTTAQPFDLDGDGDKDLVLGYEMGDVFFAENTGTNEAPEFTGYVPLQCASGAMNVYTTFPGGGRARENVFDYNSDGVPDILSGCSNGWIYVFLGSLTGIGGDEPDAGLSIGILETPSAGVFPYELTAPGGGVAAIRVLDLSGRTVILLEGAAAGQGTLDLTGCPTGAYLVTAETDGGIATARLVKL
ncbi:MAG TPA: T9SS type A sorting domain-containing protein, partial [Candidatus Fermentibacter sp.]|nr:T9SS type A sorting domain-containing protein [Candidatus Fermentibacter sp.]